MSGSWTLRIRSLGKDRLGQSKITGPKNMKKKQSKAVSVVGVVAYGGKKQKFGYYY